MATERQNAESRIILNASAMSENCNSQPSTVQLNTIDSGEVARRKATLDLQKLESYADQLAYCDQVRAIGIVMSPGSPKRHEDMSVFLDWLFASIEKSKPMGMELSGQLLIDDFRVRVNNPPLPLKDFLFIELENIKKEVDGYSQKKTDDANSLPRSLFCHSYNRVLSAKPPYDYKELFDLTYGRFGSINNKLDTQTVKWLIQRPGTYFENLLRGKALAEYHGFLLKQLERIESGEDIRKPKANDQDTFEEVERNPVALLKEIKHKQQILIAFYLLEYGLISIPPQLSQEAQCGILNSLFGRGLTITNTKKYLNSLNRPQDKDPEKVKTVENLQAILPYFEKIDIPEVVRRIKEDIVKANKKNA